MKTHKLDVKKQGWLCDSPVSWKAELAANHSKDWREVTCKRCLKLKPKGNQ